MTLSFMPNTSCPCRPSIATSAESLYANFAYPKFLSFIIHTSIRLPKRLKTSLRTWSGGGAGLHTINKREATSAWGSARAAGCWEGPPWCTLDCHQC